VVIFALILGLLELYQGTSPTFVICAFLFIVISGATFNLAGGLSRPSGAYVGAYAILVVILGLCWKAVLWEPANSNLLQPDLTMEIYLGSIVSMYAAVAVSRLLTSRRPLLGNLVTDANMQNATAGCLVTGLTVLVIIAMTEVADRKAGGVLSAVAQLNNFLPMALILGVLHEAHKSGGRRTVNLSVLIAGGSIFVAGLLAFSKEAIFMPLACWVVAAGSVGYRLSRMQIVGLLFCAYFMFHYLVPYSQYGRNFGEASISGNISVAADMLGDLENVRAKYLQNSLDQEQGLGYYNTPQGFMDRLEMISRDDGLHDLTERRGPLGPFPLVLYFENLVPHFIWPGKPAVNFGNFYAHEMGGLSPDDFTTGISFSPAGEAYHIGGWFGIFVWAPLLWIMLFTLFDSLCGDMRTSPWGLLVAARFAHTAPEGMLGGIVYELGYFAFALVFAALAAAYVMPLLGALVKGPERTTIRRIGPVRGVPGRATPGIGQ
jgi:hypothetical protein